MDKFLSVNGVNISYRELEQGEPVLFVHGAVGDHRAWKLQRYSIADR